METIVTIGFNLAKQETVSVEVERYVPPRVPIPSESDLATVPARYRCFVCNELKGKKRFAAYIAGERVCDLCYPYVDERDIVALRPREHRPATRINRARPPLVKDIWQGVTTKMVAEAEYDELIIRVD